MKISAHDLLTTHDCPAWGCANEAEHASGLCDYHERARLALAPAAEPELELDRQERRVTGGAAPGRAHAQAWTRDEALEAIRAFMRGSDRAPRSTEWKAKYGLPSYPTVCNLFGNARTALELALDGLEPRPDRPAPEPDAPAIAGDGTANGNGAGTGDITLVNLAHEYEALEQEARELEERRSELVQRITEKLRMEAA